VRNLIIPLYEETPVKLMAPEQSGTRPRVSPSAPRAPALPSRALPDLTVSDPRLSAALDAISGRTQPVLVEAGTCSGDLALALGAARPDALVYATDESERALRTRGVRFDLPNVRFRLGALLEPLPLALRGGVDLIISSLPYTPPGVVTAVASLLWPAGAPLGVGEDGLQLLRRLAVTAREFLVPGGSLVLQLASFQWYGFAQDLFDLGYEPIQLLKRSDNVVTARAVWP
jgi:methylase of polypeptide subunit release factors